MSKSTNDHKWEGLINYLEVDGGHIDDLELTMMLQVAGEKPTEDQINDVWHRYLVLYKGLDGHINDMFYQFLINQGIPPQHINDMWHAFWELFVGFEPPPRFPYEFEMPDTSIQIYQFDSFADYEFQLPVV